jgi:hypothetical protein
MTEQNGVGGYFSRNYLRPNAPLPDSKRLRLRLATYLVEHFADKSSEIGRFIERELGIRVLSRGPMYAYVSWEQVLEKCAVSDLLDIVTACFKFISLHSRPYQISEPGAYLIAFVDRAFREQNLAYRIDESGGIHPFIDIAFSSELAEVVRHLSDQSLKSARQSVDRAEAALLDKDFNGRLAVRSIFDATENIFKLICPRMNQLNKQNITNELRPIILRVMADNPHEQRAAGKLVDAFANWVEAGHNYRHDPGHTDPTAPSSVLTITYVSQGLGYVRWLADVFVSNRP